MTHGSEDQNILEEILDIIKMTNTDNIVQDDIMMHYDCQSDDNFL